MQGLQPRECTRHDGIVVADVGDVIAGGVAERELPVVAHRQSPVGPDVLEPGSDTRATTAAVSAELKLSLTTTSRSVSGSISAVSIANPSVSCRSRVGITTERKGLPVTGSPLRVDLEARDNHARGRGVASPAATIAAAVVAASRITAVT